jgi:anti-anti-sigma factor
VTGNSFEASTRLRDRVVVLDFVGDIDARAEGSLTGAYAEACQVGPSTILMNFERVNYINSTGIALIVGVLARARKEGRTIAACELSDHFREIFEITRLVDYIGVYEDEASAIASAAN